MLERDSVVAGDRGAGGVDERKASSNPVRTVDGY
jgi:hypothetical protein